MTERDPLGLIGQIVAEKYRVERLVGEGGFAVVYRAQHMIWNKPVAIKFFNGLSSAPVDQREQFQRAFIQEGALLTELSSQTAAIVQARDVGTYTTPDGAWMPFMVLEWLEGAALDEVLDRERLEGRAPWTLSEVIRLLGQAAAALDVAHGKGIAHRDVKPANLFVLGEPRSPRATLKVLDFGVAKMVSDNTQLKAAMAKTGMSVTSFTPQYGAPEQFTRSHGATGPWTDVYALALVAAEMLSGRAALEGDDLIQLGFATGNPERRPTPRTLGVMLPDAIEAVFARALEVSPERRYARAAEFWADLEAATQASGLTLPTWAPNRTSPTGVTELAPAKLTPARTTGEPPQPQPPAGVFDVRATAGTATVSQTNPPAARGGGAAIAAGLGVLAVLGAGMFFFFKSSNGGDTAAVALPAATSAPVAPPAPSVAPEPTCPEGTVKIPGGQFFQGSDAKDARDNERPSHNVTLNPFCMDLYEVTAGAYKACSDVGKCKRAGTEVEWPNITPADRKIYSPLCTVDDADRLDHPINCVTWEMANLYCKAHEKRLPTEAEWEYATRGPDGRVYPWGDDAPTEKHLNACGAECAAWGRKQRIVLEPLYTGDDGFPTTAPVGKFEAGKSRFGPYDVAGNVWEWVADWAAPYTADEKKNPKGPETGERKVIRGGAWNGSYASWLRPSFRYAQDPAALSHGIGFRCARALAPEP
jgi:formylglycine-generating enzyme required for sulfatase activity/serine/threonine protein kinase